GTRGVLRRRAVGRVSRYVGATACENRTAAPFPKEVSVAHATEQPTKLRLLSKPLVGSTLRHLAQQAIDHWRKRRVCGAREDLSCLGSLKGHALGAWRVQEAERVAL